MNIRGRQRVKFYTHVLRAPIGYTAYFILYLADLCIGYKGITQCMTYKGRLYPVDNASDWFFDIQRRLDEIMMNDRNQRNIYDDAICSESKAEVYADIAERKRNRK